MTAATHTRRTQVGIVGSGPAGLMLAQLLHRQGIDSVVLESRSREHVRSRQRAGVLEEGTVALMREAGLGARIGRLGMPQHGIDFRFGGASHRVDYAAATGGRTVTVYPQHEVVADLMDARDASGAPTLYEAAVTRVEGLAGGLAGGRPVIHYTHGGESHALACDFVAGCDGFHGVCREAIPAEGRRVYDRVYPFAWLGILADAAPATPEIAWGCHDDGFAMMSLRSPSVTRLYLQCAPDEDPDAWSDARIWDALHARLDVPGLPALNEGPIRQKAVTGMRSFLVEPMHHGRLYLAGDAAHIVPPTGAKGLNSAFADIQVLARALMAHYGERSDALLDRYSETCLRRMWLVQRFSAGLCNMVHRFPGDDAFVRRLQRADLDYLTGTVPGRLAFADNFVGLPIEA